MEPAWITRLRQLVADRYGGNMKKASLALGLGETFIRDMLKRGRKPGVDKLEKIASHFGVPVSELFDMENIGTDKLVTYADVVGMVAAGVWVDSDYWRNTPPTEVPIVHGRFKHLPQVAYEVHGDSMDNAGFTDGGYVIVVEIDKTGQSVRTGDYVLVERHDGQKIERTVKLAEVLPDRIVLSPESSNPRWTPITIMKDGSDGTEDRHTRISGLVVGYYRVVGR